MKKASCFFALICLLSAFSFAQNYRDRHPFDFKKFNLGLQMGFSYNTYNLKEQINVGNGMDTLRRINLRPRPGVHFGMIANLNLGRQIALRAIPSISLEQRDIAYNIDQPEGSRVDIRKIDPAYFDLPILIQWKTSYWQRLRFYALTGAQLSVNMTRTEKVNDNPELIKLSRYDAALVFGFGMNMYGDKVKFSPEIRYKLGLNNIYVPDNTTFANAISRLSSQVVSITFNFE